jgi:hypothetical protein
MAHLLSAGFGPVSSEPHELQPSAIPGGWCDLFLEPIAVSDGGTAAIAEGKHKLRPSFDTPTAIAPQFQAYTSEQRSDS